MCFQHKWTPLATQGFASLGSILTMLVTSMVVTFTSVLLPQRRASPDWNHDINLESWLISIVGVAVMFGVLTMSVIMSKYGRKIGNMFTATLFVVTWIAITQTANYYSLLFIRFLQGLAVGAVGILAPVSIGEYCSPKYRGIFLVTISLSISLGVTIMHVLGSFLHWTTISVICGIIAFIDVLVIIYSPESPSFYASRGRYDECRKAFHQLRGFNEEEELEKMIKDDMVTKSERIYDTKGTALNVWLVFADIVRKKEVYKPIIVMCHLHMLSIWTASCVLDAFTTDIIKKVLDPSINVNIVMISMDIQRVISNTCAIVLIKKFRRRVVLVFSISFNITVLLSIAAYVYARENNLLPFDHPSISILLLHFQVFTIATGCLTLPNTIAGEIFPLEYKSLGSMISQGFFCINIVINTKTALLLFEKIGLHGTYLMYAIFVIYALVVTLKMLPETKDKTLLEIEQEFRGEKLMLDVSEIITKEGLKEEVKLI